MKSGGWTVFWITLVMFVFIACGNKSETVYEPEYSDQSQVHKETYIFGVHPLYNPIRLFEIFQPLVDYLNRRLPEQKIVLEASRNYSAYNKKLFQGHFHLSLPNPYQTVEATKHGYRIFGKMGDDENFRGIILIRKGSPIRTIMDLKGKAVSYPASTALAATMMPQWFLSRGGLNINRDIKNNYVGSQESSIMNVYLGQTSAGATWPPPWRTFAKKRPEIANQLEVKWQTPFLPNNGLVARDDLPEDYVEKLGNLLFSLHETEDGQAILSRMELSRFESATEKTYDPVRDFLVRFEREIRPVGGD